MDARHGGAAGLRHVCIHGGAAGLRHVGSDMEVPPDSTSESEEMAPQSGLHDVRQTLCQTPNKQVVLLPLRTFQRSRLNRTSKYERRLNRK
jgi:hypothetical protein